MARAVEYFLEQGAQGIGSFIDADEIIEDRALKAAHKLREAYKKNIQIRFANQVLKGVLGPKARYWFDRSLEFVDIIGGLLPRDLNRDKEHLDVLLQTAKDHDKLVHVHVDQFNTDEERETELLSQKTIEHAMCGKVSAVHRVSLAAHPEKYRQRAPMRL